MSVVFFAESKQKKAYLSLPGSIARHLLVALDYDIQEVAREAQLAPEDVLIRISVVRRQFSLGSGTEFTCDEVDERGMLIHLHELEKVAVRALDLRRNIVLL
jgi:hypothetical protein